MEFNEYQEQAMTTCMPSSANFAYMMLNLIGEVGEFAEKSLHSPMPYELREVLKKMSIIGIEAGKLGKDVRKTPDHPLQSFRPVYNEQEWIELSKESGDILWQWSGLNTIMGWENSDIAQQNLDKLAARKAAGTINGSGDGINGTDRKAE